MYDLHDLGWHSFQQLCVTIAREILGQTVESFLDSADAGRDGAFSGTWIPRQGETLAGRFVIQCKFTSKRERNLKGSDLADEVKKVRRLVKREVCDCYIVMTNFGVSGSTTQDIERIFKKAGVKQVATFGATWICDTIRDNKQLRMLVPRVYGLGDLSQILDERAYRQSKALLVSLREDLSKVVITSAYRRAAEALSRYGFVLLIGEPAAGKTTIASMLAMAALDQWGSSTLKLDTPQKVVDHWNPDEPSQFFWIDDAFGVMQYESYAVSGWNHILPQIRTMLQKGTKIVMTSRDYIYNQARKDLKEGAFPLLRESQVVIDVRELTADERQQILYNHMRLGKQDRPFKTAIKPYLPLVANHPRFVPEIARRLGDPIFTRGLTLAQYYVEQFVEKQEQFLHEVIVGLDKHSKAALALIYMRANTLESPIRFSEPEQEAIKRLGSNVGECIDALDALDGSLVQYVKGDKPFWRFKHPTIGDAFAKLLLEKSELLDIYLHGISTEQLMEQVTCGDVGLKHAVILPENLFAPVLERLGAFSSSAKYKTPAYSLFYAKDRLHGFLSSRCSKVFLSRYLHHHPEILAQVSDPGLMLYAVSEVGLAIRLNELGLLPEETRKAFVRKVTAYAVDGEDLYALDNARIQAVFTPTELDELHAQIRKTLVPSLPDLRWNRQDNWPSDQSPEEYMEGFLDSLETLKKHYSDEPSILVEINCQMTAAQEWITKKMEDESQKQRPPRTFSAVDPTGDSPLQMRSIFDDVDA